MFQRAVVPVSVFLVFAAFAAHARALECVPGAQVECACGGGRTGVQVCAKSGTELEPCKCEAPAPAPAAAPAKPASSNLGSIHVASESKATVYIDGEPKGQAPVDVQDVQPGWYRVRVVREDGSEDSEDVEVTAGSSGRVFFEVNPSAVAFTHRRGASFGFTLGGGEWFELHTGDNHGPFGAVGGFANFGLARAVDARVGLTAMIGSTGSLGTSFLVGVPMSIRFNLGSVYTMWFGANVAYRRTNPAYSKCTEITEGTSSWNTRCSDRDDNTNRPDSGLSIAPELSFLTFRFGSKRQFEIALTQGMSFAITKSEFTPNNGFSRDKRDNSFWIFYNVASFSMLLL